MALPPSRFAPIVVVAGSAGKIELADAAPEQTPAVVEAVQKGLPRDFPADVLDPILAGLSRQAKAL